MRFRVVAWSAGLLRGASFEATKPELVAYMSIKILRIEIVAILVQLSLEIKYEWFLRHLNGFVVTKTRRILA